MECKTYTRSWSSQYLSSLFLKVLSVFDVTIFSGRLFQYLTTLIANEYFLREEIESGIEEPLDPALENIARYR
jgi:hypothetical protein